MVYLRSYYRRDPHLAMLVLALSPTQRQSESYVRLRAARWLLYQIAKYRVKYHMRSSQAILVLEPKLLPCLVRSKKGLQSRSAFFFKIGLRSKHLYLFDLSSAKKQITRTPDQIFGHNRRFVYSDSEHARLAWNRMTSVLNKQYFVVVFPGGV